jgi:hypothetical protein
LQSTVRVSRRYDGKEADQLRKRMFRHLSFLASFLLLAVVAVRSQAVVALTADQLQNGKVVELDKLNWKYQPGDDPQFADPQFDDSAWATLASSAKPEDSNVNGSWRGIGWSACTRSARGLRI